jgi:hypothetical protein
MYLRVHPSYWQSGSTRGTAGCLGQRARWFRRLTSQRDCFQERHTRLSFVKLTWPRVDKSFRSRRSASREMIVCS